jgi:hypothetical protein
VSDDILTRIDVTLSDVSGSMERNAVRFHPTAEGEVEHGCTVNGMRWRPYGAKNITEEVPEPVEAAVHGNVVAQLEDLAEHLDRALAEEMVPSGTSPGVSFADVAAGPVAGVDAAVDVRRRVQDGTAPAPDPVGDVLRAEVLRQGLTECEIDGVRWVHVLGEWMTAPASGGPPGSWFDETHVFRRAYLNQRIAEVMGAQAELLDQPEPEPPLVDAVVEPDLDVQEVDAPCCTPWDALHTLPDGHSVFCFDRPTPDLRPWWLRWLPGGRR